MTLDGCYYICAVCSKKMTAHTLVAHIKSVPHRLKFSVSLMTILIFIVNVDIFDSDTCKCLGFKPCKDYPLVYQCSVYL